MREIERERERAREIGTFRAQGKPTGTEGKKNNASVAFLVKTRPRVEGSSSGGDGDDDDDDGGDGEGSQRTSPIQRAKYLLPFFPFLFRPNQVRKKSFSDDFWPNSPKNEDDDCFFRSGFIDEDHPERNFSKKLFVAVLQRRLNVLCYQASTRGHPV